MGQNLGLQMLEQCSQLLAGDHIHHQLSFECALTRMHISLFLHCPSWQECITIVQDVLVRTKDSDEYWHAHGLNTLGSLYAVGGLGQQAMEAFTLAANLLLCLGCNRDAGLALYSKAHALDQLYAPDEQVLEAAQEGSKLLDTDTSHAKSDNLAVSGLVLLRMGRLVEASQSFEKCLHITQEYGAVLA